MRDAGDILRATVSFAMATGHLLFPLALAGIIPAMLLEELVGRGSVLGFAAYFAVVQIITGALTLTAWSLLTKDVFDPARDVNGAMFQMIPLVALGFTVLGIIAAGFLALIVPGIYAMAALTLTIPVLMLEGQGLRSLMVSWDRTEPLRWTLVAALVFGLGMLFLGFALVGNLLITLGVAPLIGVIADGIFSAITLTLSVCFSVLVYGNLTGIPHRA